MLRFVYFSLFAFSGLLHAQQELEKTGAMVGTVEFCRDGYPLSFPVINIEDDEHLQLRFDLFTTEQDILSYSVTLCDYDWQLPDVDPNEYIDGYLENTFEAYSPSINTMVDYVQYRLFVPNSDVKILKPGNYILKVYNSSFPDSIILAKRFVVFTQKTEPEIEIDGFASQSLITQQELKVTVDPVSIDYSQLASSIQLMILQNNNWRSARYYKKFNYSGSNFLSFNTPGQIVFNGENEFRFFDSKSLKFISERVKRIEYVPPYYHVYLKPDQPRGSKDYFTNEDLNGLFYIDNTDTDYEDVMDADYIWVHFELNSEYAYPSDVYIDGAITEWKFTDNYMLFDVDCGCYKGQLFLKQGLYNYRYALQEYDTKQFSFDIIEGNHYQTNNSYLAIVYYKPFGEFYHQPVGVAVTGVNSQ
ncbi:MAG: DUF5103 domain-containing protein [Bacteroidales bacterium]|nr:DUF5103 domain-containing protein [Bacteroidales bacterium]MBN2818492.1 DUF5103 domain-containing protein [Bacteroidales bacterium]